MNAEYKKILDKYIRDYAGIIDRMRIEEILSLSDNHIKDQHINDTKILKLKRLKMLGTKPSTKENINFTHNFEAGVNLFIADNLRGKSTILKIIKWCLTGNKIDSISHWFDHILLQFTINEDKYTIVIEQNSTMRSQYKIFAKYIDIEKLGDSSEHLIHHAKNDKNITEYLEKFFFEQLNYYSLKWTQKNSAKSSIELSESGTSWKTYYSSFFLQSNNSLKFAFGKQETKFFEMLMGLEWTASINELSVKRAFLENEKAKERLVQSSQNTTKEELEKKLKIIKSDYEECTQNLNIEINNKRNDYSKLSEEYNNESVRIRRENDTYNRLLSKQEKLQRSVNEYKNQIKAIEKKIAAKEKYILGIKEHRESKMFFSSLNVTYCPCCLKSFNPISNSSAAECSCSLCKNTVDTNQDINDDNFNDAISLTEAHIEELRLQIESIDQLLKESLSKINILNSSITSIKTSPNIDLDITKSKLENLNNDIADLTSRSLSSNEKAKQLLKSMGAIEDKLSNNSFEVDRNQNIRNIQSEIDLIYKIETELKSLRIKKSDVYLSNFKAMMYDTLQKFGLTSLIEVNVSDSMDIKFRKKNMVELQTFDQLSEGEKLRAKIALAICFIKLDIEHNAGKHPHFIIIDSPASEEADATYMKGLIDTLKIINSELSNNCQIIIATAKRELVGQFTNEKCALPNEYLF